MKVYNEEKTTLLTEYDLDKGYLKADTLFVKHHEAQEEVQEQSHYKTIKEYENGGKDVEKVIDVPYQPAKEAYDEYEDIQVYVPYSKKELNQQRIAELKQHLADTDYKAIKYAEGLISAEDYAEMKAQRQAWRDEINKLEHEL